jgi:hypothetical protein
LPQQIDFQISDRLNSAIIKGQEWRKSCAATEESFLLQFSHVVSF